MYGCPSETVQETVDSLERVRQLVKADLIQSAFWHRFTATAHSPIGLQPAAHGLRILGPEFQGFAENDLQHEDRRSKTPEWLGEGLRRSMLNYLEGNGLTLDVRQWFDHSVPKPLVSLPGYRNSSRDESLETTLRQRGDSSGWEANRSVNRLEEKQGSFCLAAQAIRPSPSPPHRPSG